VEKSSRPHATLRGSLTVQYLYYLFELEPFEYADPLGQRIFGAIVGPMIKIGFGEKLHSATKLAAIIEALLSEGIPANEALSGVQVRVDELHSPTTRISLNQMIAACRNAISLTSDPQLAFHIGSSIHLSTYGMFGYAMLSGTDFRNILDFAAKYHQLATPLAQIALETKDRCAIWTITPVPHPRIDAALYQFITEMQLGIHLSLSRDVMGSSFALNQVAVTYRPAKCRALDELVECPLLVEQPENLFVFDAAWLERVPTLGNRTTHAAMLTICDGLLGDIMQCGGVAGRVRRVLLQDISNCPNFETVAKLLRTPPRTLRRQLRAQSTSFRELIDELRAQVAIKYLRDTQMTSEDIAQALGFSDAANFRHAFRRWTKASPSMFKHISTDQRLSFES
jgi:AraC-like DNA-binding protein